ncbi:hypothetical protein B0J11DRAFT_503723 [Dendryphion nanum]|uniref:Transcription factor domain-containing protein n=1 Tax=Dendryphion nanum TaxID=256645 RepID=A0A9P9E600_9PLEO|nr:hypothetical protein B0J11DRAFT_503723 [Dendryphion nanum]
MIQIAIQDPGRTSGGSTVQEKRYEPEMETTIPFVQPSAHESAEATGSSEIGFGHHSVGDLSYTFSQPESPSFAAIASDLGDLKYIEDNGFNQTGSSDFVELVWHLQTQSEAEARSTLQYIRQHGPKRWLQYRSAHLSMTGSSVSSMLRAMTNIPSPINTNFVLGGIAQHISIDTVKDAVASYYLSTGQLFYVNPEDHVNNIVEEILGDYQPTETFTAVLSAASTLQTKGKLAELCGMAAVGLCYLRLSDQEKFGSPHLCDFFYMTAKDLFDSSIEANSLRAIKLCALFAIYNILKKARVAHAYIELGLGLARAHAVDADHCPTNMDLESWLDGKRTWRTLVLFSCWLSSSLGYAVGHTLPSVSSLATAHDVSDDHIIQRELVKVTMIKGNIIHKFADSNIIDGDAIANIRQEFMVFNKELPDWISMKSLLGSSERAPFRRLIFYLHLFLLSGMQLLYRRIIVHSSNHGEMKTDEDAKSAILEGVTAARIAARILNVMKGEQAIVKICWMFAQKIICGQRLSRCRTDLDLVQVSIDALKSISEIDSTAARFHKTLSRYMEVLNESGDSHMHHDSKDNEFDDTSIDYLFNNPPGDTDIHKATEDLRQLVRCPFITSLNLIPEQDLLGPDVDSTLFSLMEAVVGAPEEWNYEMRKCDGQCDDKDTARKEADKGKVKAKDKGKGKEPQAPENLTIPDPGHSFPDEGVSPWTIWTPAPF